MKVELRQETRWLDSDVETVIGLFLGRLGSGDGLLLESVEVDGRWGRYSLVAGDFILAAAARAGRLELKVFDDRLQDLTALSGRPFFEGLAELADTLTLVPEEEAAACPPITRALYGWLGFGAASGDPADGNEEGVFVLPGTVYLFDHTYNQLVQLSLRPEAAPGPPPPGPGRAGPVKAAWDEDGYLAAASTLMNEIRQGRLREASLAARFSADYNGDLFSAYRRLRRLSPSAYMVFMRFGDFSLAVSSPEPMVTCERNKLFLSPMAGSRTQEIQGLAEDNLFEDELISDPRELTRHLALLNQGREELLQVAAPGSVKVERFMERERFENLRRLTSRLAATVAEGRSGVEVLKTLFPAGAVIGAPKAEALKLIGGLEPEPRGPYGGAVGWLGLDKAEVNLDFGLTTHGWWKRGGRAFWAVGEPLSEETDLKNVWREIVARAETARSSLEPESAARAVTAAAVTPAAGPPLPPAALPAETPETALRLPVLMENLAAHLHLGRAEAAHLFARLLDGELSPAQAGALLMGLKSKGETPVEVAEAARAVLDRAVPLPPLSGPFLDIVGTGGDSRYTFNCSTAAALTMAGLGYKVVKHGNRSVSSKCGSADVLERLGEDLNRPPEAVPEALARRNFVFLFAPAYHPSFRHIMPVRKDLGIRTLFNILGPLVNPARPDYSFLGAPNRTILPLMAETQRLLGTKFTALVCGAGDYDEMTALGPAAVFLVEGDKITETAIDPARYGFEPCEPRALTISGPAEGEKVLRELLAGRGPAPMRDMLILNVALAIYVFRGAESFDLCLNEARQAVEGGAGGRVLPSA